MKKPLFNEPCGKVCPLDKLFDYVDGEHTGISIPVSTARVLIQAVTHQTEIHEREVYKVDQDDGLIVLAYIWGENGYMVTFYEDPPSS